MSRSGARRWALGLMLSLSAAAQATPVCSGNCNIGGGVVDVGSAPGSVGSLSLSGGDQLATARNSFIGWNGGRGTALVRDAGTALAVGGGTGSIFFVGADRGTGVVDVERGARVTVDAFNAGTGFGDARLFLGSGGDGTMNIRSGGALVVRDQGNFGAEDGLQIGRSTVAGGTGVGRLVIDGPGSSATVRGNYSFVNVGQANGTFSAPQAGIGSIDVSSGGRLLIDSPGNSSYLLLGRGDAAQGYLTVSGVGSRVDMTGAFAWAEVGSAASATSFEGTGLGRVHVGGGGVWSLAGSAQNTLLLGRLGRGELLVDSGGRVEVNNGDIYVSRGTSTLPLVYSGRLTVNGTGVVQANRIVIGDGRNDRINGVLDGTGTVQGNVTVRRGGEIAPGNSPGRLTVDGDLSFIDGGVLHIEVAGLGAGQFDVLDVLGDADLSGALIEFDFIGGFAPAAGDQLDFLLADAVTGLGQAEFRFTGLAPGFQFDVAAGGGALRFTALNAAVSIPAPGTLALLAGALPGVLLPLLRRRRPM